LKVGFKKSFVKDLKRLEHAPVRQQVKDIIERVERAQSLGDISNIKKLRGGEHYYRIRLGDYRFGIVFEEDTVIFVRFLHRKDLYRYFP
jgi:mRNA interferase RelE/StbE